MWTSHVYWCHDITRWVTLQDIQQTCQATHGWTTPVCTILPDINLSRPLRSGESEWTGGHCVVRCFVSHTEAAVGGATTVTGKPDPHYILWPDPVEVTSWCPHTGQLTLVSQSHLSWSGSCELHEGCSDGNRGN